MCLEAAANWNLPDAWGAERLRFESGGLAYVTTSGRENAGESCASCSVVISTEDEAL